MQSVKAKLDESFSVVIIGGGSAGISVASRLVRYLDPRKILIVEPSEKHYYQPMWTLVGAGQVRKETTERDESRLIPSGVQWMKKFVTEIHPEENFVTLEDGSQVRYQFLVVCPGIQQDWNKIQGLEKSLGRGGVCSNYDYKYVDYTWKVLQSTMKGRLVFMVPPMPIKCPGAPQKIMWLAEDYLREKGVRKSCEIHFVSAPETIFGVPRYREPLERLLRERGVHAAFGKNLVGIDGEKKIAEFVDLKSGEKMAMNYDMLHVVPPMSAPDFLKKGPLVNQAGWVDVDKNTLQHVKYPNVFSLGDASSAPCSKTGAAIRKQAPVVVENLMSMMKSEGLRGVYDGYASCPLVTRKNRCILAEFGYDGKIMETFPFAQNKERWSMYLLKRHVLPRMYWDFMLKGKG